MTRRFVRAPVRQWLSTTFERGAEAAGRPWDVPRASLQRIAGNGRSAGAVSGSAMSSAQVGLVSVAARKRGSEFAARSMRQVGAASLDERKRGSGSSTARCARRATEFRCAARSASSLGAGAASGAVGFRKRWTTLVRLVGHGVWKRRRVARRLRGRAASGAVGSRKRVTTSGRRVGQEVSRGRRGAPVFGNAGQAEQWVLEDGSQRQRGR